MTPGSAIPDTEIAWAAGFFDGEGSVVARKTHGGRYVYPTIAAYQSSEFGVPEELIRFANAIEVSVDHISGRGYNHISSTKRPGQRPEYHFRVQGTEAIRALCILWPYLSTAKRKKALDVAASSTMKCSFVSLEAS